MSSYDGTPACVPALEDPCSDLDGGGSVRSTCLSAFSASKARKMRKQRVRQNVKQSAAEVHLASHVEAAIQTDEHTDDSAITELKLKLFTARGKLASLRHHYKQNLLSEEMLTDITSESDVSEAEGILACTQDVAEESESEICEDSESDAEEYSTITSESVDGAGQGGETDGLGSVFGSC